MQKDKTRALMLLSAGVLAAAVFGFILPLSSRFFPECLFHKFTGLFCPGCGAARGIRLLYKALEKNNAVAMLPDQEPQAGTGMFAPFFGIQAYSMVFLSRLSLKTGAPIIFAWCERLSWGRGYHLHFRSFSDVNEACEIDSHMAAVNRAVERCVRECPEQYQWSYRRFKSRPKGEAPFYKKTASSEQAKESY